MLSLEAYKINVNTRNLAALNSEKEGGYGVLYKCAHCGTPTCEFLGKYELFCHHCGESLSWNVITFISPNYSNILKQMLAHNQTAASVFEQGLLKMVNTYNDEHGSELLSDPDLVNYWSDDV